MEKIDISDVTFTIPVRIDKDERLRHLITTVGKIQRDFKTNILIGELSNRATADLRRFCRLNNCGYVYFNTDKPYFHRTKLLNDLARISTTPFIVNMDSDVAAEPNAIIESVTCLRETAYDIVIPYDGTVINIIDKKHSIVTSKKACGGVVFWIRESFFRAGMENENFIDWGFEDNERLSRAKILGLAKRQLPAYKLYHLNHSTTENYDGEMLTKYRENNREELKKIMKMEKKELIEYIKTWEWI